MKLTLPMLMTTAAMLSFQPALAATDAPIPVTPADEIAADIERSGHAAPVVAFYRGTPQLTAASESQLVELVKVLEADPELHIQVGFQADDAQLAAERARALRNALLSLNAPGSRVAIAGG